MATGEILYSGIPIVVGSSFTLSRGVGPSVSQLTTVPHTRALPKHGTLTFRYGSFAFYLHDCAIQNAQLNVATGGFQWQITIADRRWRWKFSSIDGYYNIRKDTLENAGDEIIPETRRSLRELIVLLFQAMGERNYRIVSAPNNIFPEVRWDHANCADELSQLLEDVSCDVAMGIDNVARIVQIGQGAFLPSIPGEISRGYGLTPGVAPSEILVVSGPISFEDEIVLEAVGLETDANKAEVKPIDDLSYKPTKGGWKKCDEMMLNVFDEHGLEAQERARKTVFRWYRIKKFKSLPGKTAPGGVKLDAISEILPIKSVQNEREVQPDGSVGQKKAEVYGVFVHADDADAEDEDKNKDRLYDDRFTIDGNSGIVKFSNTVYRVDDNGDYLEADLFLRTSFEIGGKLAPPKAFEWRSRVIGSEVASGVHSVFRRDIIPRISRRANKTTDNLPDTRKQLRDAASEAAIAFSARETHDKTYAGLVPTSPDGAIEQITWTTDMNGAITQMSRNTEHHMAIPRSKERRRITKLDRIHRREQSRTKSETLAETDQ